MGRSIGVNFATSTLGWIAATILGWFGLLGASAVLFMPAGAGLPGIIAAAAAGGFGGLIMAMGRWFVVRRWLTATTFGAWTAAGALGFAIALALVYLMGGTGVSGAEGLGLAVVWAVGGLVAGLIQALAMGGVRGSAWWVPATALSWAVLIALSRSSSLGDAGALVGIAAEAILSWLALIALLGASNRAAD